MEQTYINANQISGNASFKILLKTKLNFQGLMVQDGQ